MTRKQLEHLIRAAAVIADDDEIVVIGSQAILGQFPFLIRGFHSDNGSDFINDSVSGLLKRLLIEQTKSRPRRSNPRVEGAIPSGQLPKNHMCVSTNIQAT